MPESSSQVRHHPSCPAPAGLPCLCPKGWPREEHPEWPEHLTLSSRGYWQVTFKWRGKRYRESTRETSVTRAKAFRDDFIKRIKGAAGALRTSTPLTFAEWWDIYKSAYSSQKADPHRDETIVGWALPTFGRHLLVNVPPSMCANYLIERRRNHDTPRGTPLTPGALLKERNLLQAIFQKAVENGHLEKNPWKGIARPKQRTKERVLSWEEQARLEEVCGEWFKRWMRFILGTGVRLESVSGKTCVKREDFAIHAGYVRVREKGKDGEKKERFVPLLGDSAQMAEEQWKAKGCYWPQDPSLFRKELYRYAVKVGLSEERDGKQVSLISPHTLRHTFATRYLQGGGDIYTLSQILGHSSVKTTETVYAHIRREDLLALSAHIKLRP